MESCLVEIYGLIYLKKEEGIIKRILAISDIHGCYDELIKLLTIVSYRPEHDQLIFVGDYIDRGQKSKQVLVKLIALEHEGAIVLRGNHCQMFLDWLLSDDFAAGYNFFNNGGIQTIESYVGYDWFEDGLTKEATHKAKNYINDNFKDHVQFLYHTKHYHEIDEHVFVHAGIEPLLKDWKNTSESDMIWIREGFLNHNHKHNKVFVHGHTPCLNLHNSHDIYFGNKKIGIDGACAYGGQLNCLEIKDGEYKQYSVKRGGDTLVK